MLNIPYNEEFAIMQTVRGAKMSFQGTEFTPEMRKLVVNVKQFFSLNKKKYDDFNSKSSITLTASAMGIGEATVRNIMLAFNKGGEVELSQSGAENRGRPSYSIEGGIEVAIREYVRNTNKHGQQVTIDSIKKFLLETASIELPETTLWRTLTRWGFEFGKGTRSAHLKESQRIIIQRRQYLRIKIANRREDGSTIRPEIYLDESYINKNHSRDDSWFVGGDDFKVSKPTGKGERLIIVNAIDCNGWVPNAKYVFKSKKKTTDYHTSMNWKVFKEWFENQLLPNIPDNSIIIMDNAQYHNVLSEASFPQKKNTAFHLRYWLSNNKINWTEDMLKEELYELCSRFAPAPEFAIDKIAANKGHTILRTPPYHPELQPIEICWAVVKGYVAKHNDFTMKNVKELLEQGFNKVDKQTISGILKTVKKKEDTFWVEDSKLSDANEAHLSAGADEEDPEEDD